MLDTILGTRDINEEVKSLGAYISSGGRQENKYKICQGVIHAKQKDGKDPTKEA